MAGISKIRVLVVDDSQFFRTLIVRGLSSDPFIDVVGDAVDVYDARDKIINLKPHIMILDVQMPHMNGIDFLMKLLPQYPMPVVVISSASESVFDAIKAGAVDFVAKPGEGNKDNINNFISDLIFKVKIASTVKIGKKANKLNDGKESQNDNSISKNVKSMEERCFDIIAIGASTGGTEATHDILRRMPEDSPGIVIVQHMPPVFTRMYAERLDSSSKIKVREARDGDEVKRGTALIAPGGYQMKLLKKGDKYNVSVYEGEKVSGHCPSVDVLFNSVADCCNKNAIGVILTGMGSDGSKGLLNMKKKGAFTIGQNEKSCVVYGMPKVAYDIGAVGIQGDVDEITNILINKIASIPPCY